MAKNQKFERNSPLKMSVIAGTVSGEPVAKGSLSGVALNDRDADGFATVAREGVYKVPVVASTDDSSPTGGSSAVAEGDKLYVNAATGVVSKDTSGTVFFGWATEAVSAGQQATIAVALSGGGFGA